MRTGDRARTTFARVMKGDPSCGIALDPLDGGVSIDADAILFKDLAHCLRYVGIFACNQTRVALHDRDFGAEAPIHLTELQPDVAPADDDHVLRLRIELHYRRRIQIR